MNIAKCPDCHRPICICEKRRTAPSLCYGSCTHLWRVTFDSTFSSASGIVPTLDPALALVRMRAVFRENEALLTGDKDKGSE